MTLMNSLPRLMCLLFPSAFLAFLTSIFCSWACLMNSRLPCFGLISRFCSKKPGNGSVRSVALLDSNAMKAVSSWKWAIEGSLLTSWKTLPRLISSKRNSQISSPHVRIFLYFLSRGLRQMKHFWHSFCKDWNRKSSEWSSELWFGMLAMFVTNLLVLKYKASSMLKYLLK